MSSFNVTFNSSNLVQSGIANNTFTLKFVQGNFNIPENAEISCTQLTIPYSWRNITSVLGNNTFTYNIPTGGSGFATYNVVLPDGFYTEDDINTYFQSVMKANGHYWYLNTSTNLLNPQIIYPLSFAINTTLYTTSITSVTIPISANIASSFGANWVQASNWSGAYPTVANTCGQININSSINKILGFTIASYPSSYTGISLSQTIVNGNSLNAYPSFVPMGSTVNGIVLRCSLCANSITYPNDILTTIPINSTYGSNINYLNTNSNNYVSCLSGKFQNINISLYDQNLNPIYMLDPNILITINIKF